LFAHRLAEPVSAMTGIGRYVEHLVRALADLAPADWEFAASATREDTAVDWLPPTVAHRVVRGPRQPVHLAWTALHAPRLERLVAGRFDLLHALLPSFPLPTRKPAVLTIHDVMAIEHPEWHRRVERWGTHRTIEYAVDHGWWFIADSAYSRDVAAEVAGVPRERVTVVHLAVDDDFRRPPTGDRQRSVCTDYGVEPGDYLLAIGNVSTRKNVPTLIRALAGAADVTAPLLLAGRVHATGAPVLDEIERLGVRTRVRVAGFVPDDDLRVLVHAARALVHPSVDEGFGLPPLEAMAAGIPVVAGRAGSVPEVVGDAGVLVEPLDVDAWSDAITRVAGDDELRHRLRAAGLQQSARFTWRQTASATVEVYRRVLEGGSGPI
jgi:alpha-1,3-rhamnosyl/mannosyltransferase